MTIAVGQHTSVTSAFTSSLTTTGVATSASGSNFYVFIGASAAGPPTVSDNKGNTYSLVTSDHTGDFNGIHVFAYKSENGAGGSGHTVTVALANVGMAVAFVEVTGAATSGSVDISNHGGSNTQSTTVATATVTTTNANDLILSFWKGSNTGNTSVAANTGAGYALLNSATTNPAFAASSQVVSSTGTYGDTYTLGTADYAGTLTLAILSAGAGPPPPVGNSLIRTPGPGPGYPFNPLLMLGRTGSTLVPPSNALLGSATLTFSQTGSLTGSGALAGSVSLLIGETGALTGVGALAGTSTLIFGQSGTLGAPGAMTGSAALAFGQSATLMATGVLAGTSVLTLGAAGTTDQGALSGTAVLSLGQSATATGFGALIGTCQIFIDATGLVPTAAPAEIPAGRRIRNIYRVTIDGQVFEFRTLQEARRLLDDAKALAAKVAENDALWQLAKSKPKTPVITVSSRELRKHAAEAKREIAATYEKAALHAELRILLELSQRREEDETLLLLM